MFDLDNVSSFFKIVLIDLILSGDNAVVIGIAAARLSPEQRRRAIVLGGGIAVGLRIIFTILASLLLDIPLIQLVGGLLLFYIAFKLLQPADEGEHVTAADNMAQAIKTILLADVVMSLDNILAVAATADGDLWLLLFGLALSIPLLLLGSNFVATVLDRFPILLYAGVLILVHTAIHMINEDDVVHDNLGHIRTWLEWVLALTIIGAMSLYLLRLRPASKRADETLDTLKAG